MSCFHPALTEALGISAACRLVHHEGPSVGSLKGEAEEQACSVMVRLACDTDSPRESSCWASWVPCAKCSPPISSGVESGSEPPVVGWWWKVPLLKQPEKGPEGL